MPDNESFVQVFTLAACGATMLIAGAGNALLPASHRWLRTLILSLGVALSLAVTVLILPAALSRVALASVGAAILVVIAGSSRVASAASIIARPLQQAQCRRAIVGAFGLVLTIVGIAQFGPTDVIPEYRHQGVDLPDAIAMPARAEDRSIQAVTDRGTPVRLQLVVAPSTAEEIWPYEKQVFADNNWNDRFIRRRKPDNRSNCFGWTFAGGEYWIEEQVDTILTENGYKPVPTGKPGDLAVFRDGAQEACHAAVVRAVCDDGTVLVEGKWGWMGVFLHRVNDSPFGQNYVFYHSERDGHLLAGLAPNRSPASSSPTLPRIISLPADLIPTTRP